MHHQKKLTTIGSLIIGVIVLIVLLPTCKNPSEKNDKTSVTSANNAKDSFKVRPLTDIKVERTPQRLQHGKYLVNNILYCFSCHSPRNWDLAGAPPIVEKQGSGGDVLFEDSTTKIIAPNITPDKETGAGTWTDDMLARSIREGIGHDGRVLSSEMPYEQSFRYLSDEDLASVIVYLRSLPAIHHVVPATKLSAGIKSWLEKSFNPLTQSVAAPDLSDSIKRGAYLVKLGDCMGCHTTFNGDYSPGIFGGGFDINLLGHKAFSANITFDPSGINYGAEAFIFVIRTGKGGTLSPIMPWVAFKNMNDTDLKAIYAYLSTLPHAQHHITNQPPFTHCAVCGQEHGNGDKNKREKPKGIKLNPDIYEQYAGTYFNEELNYSYIITKQGNELVGQLGNGPKTELIPQSEVYFLAPGWVLPVSFIKDENEHVTALKEATDYGGVFKKIK
ncbi:MAG: hypothetical protein ABIN67_14375 [Ferruginibacter sp.]